MGQVGARGTGRGGCAGRGTGSPAVCARPARPPPAQDRLRDRPRSFPIALARAPSPPPTLNSSREPKLLVMASASLPEGAPPALGAIDSQKKVWFHTCAALLNTGVGLPPFQEARTTSSRLLPSRGVPAICLFMLSAGRRGGGRGRGGVQSGSSALHARRGLARAAPAAAALVAEAPSPAAAVASPAPKPKPPNPSPQPPPRRPPPTDVGTVVLAVVELQGGLAHVGLERVHGVGQGLQLQGGAHHHGAAAGLGAAGGGSGGRRQRG